MDLEVAQDAVRWLIENLHWKKEHKCISQQTSASVCYFGGEPTLLWDEIIEPLTKWAKQTYSDEISFNITTNGTLLDENRIRFLAEYNIIPLLSIDGAPKTQDFNRPCRNHLLQSSDLVMRNIPCLLHYFPNTTFRSTIAEETVENTFENYIFAQYLGFKNIFMMPNGRDRWSEEKLKVLEDEFKRIYMYIITCFQNNQMPPISFSSIDDSFSRIKKHNLAVLNHTSLPSSRNVNRCGLGTTMGSIGYNGNIYGCQEQDSQGKDSYFYLGNIYQDGIDKTKHEQFLQKFYYSVRSCEETSFCDSCPLSLICHDFNCPSTSYDLFQDFGKSNYVYCYWLRVMYEQAIITLQYLDTNPLFQQYLLNNCGYDFLRKE